MRLASIFKQNGPASLTMVCLVAMMLSATSSALAPSAYEQVKTAQQLLTVRDYAGAEKAYRTAIGIDPYDSLVYIQLAELMEQRGNHNEALSLYQQASTLSPKDTAIYLSMACIYEGQNQPVQALATYQKLLAANPKYYYAYLPLARAHRQLNQPYDAAKAYQTFLTQYPTHTDAQRELAALQLNTQQYQQAANTYQQLQTKNPAQFKDDLALGISLNKADRSQEALLALQRVTTPSALLYEQIGISYEKLNQLPQALEAYQKAIQLAPKEKNELNLKLADIAMTTHQPEQAESALKAYLQVNPKNGKIAKGLGDLYLQKGAYAQAEKTYLDSLAKLPTTDKVYRADVLRGLGYAQQMQNRLGDAISTYEKSLALEDNHQTRVNLAVAYHKHGDLQKALDLYRKLVVEDPKSDTLRHDMGQVMLGLGDKAFDNKEYAKAMTQYQDAFLVGGTLENIALLGIANTHYAMRNTGKAYEAYERVLKSDSGNLIARLNKAQLDLDKRNYMPALENLRYIIQKDPQNDDAYRLLGQAHERLGDYGHALLGYKQALKIKPNDTTALIGMGNAWRQMGNLDNALITYEQAKKLAPNNGLVQYNLGSIYNLKDRLDDSATAYRAAIQMSPSFLESYYGLGATLEKQKKYTEAMQVYQQYLQKAPPTASYVPLAKQRIDLLKKALPKTKATT